MPMLPVDGGIRIIGQHPDAPGSFGELMLLSEALTREVPDGVPDDAVALVDAFAVGEYYVRASGITPGDLPIVVGAGAIGLSAVAALERRGVDPVIVSDFAPERRDLAQAFGAEVLVDPAVRSPFEVWREAAAERGVATPPVVFECVGAPGLVQQLVETCEMWTRIYVAGAWYTNDTINCTDAARRGVTVQFGGGPLPDDWWATFDAVCEGRLDPLPSVGRVIGLDEVPDALDLARRADGPPRIVVHPFAETG
jgi:threonine dehydrogenase-like Zn-dependent dehydrogenase